MRMVEREVLLPVSPQQAWEALTEPELVGGWFGAQVVWELAPGGAARFVDDDGSVRGGRVDTVAPGRELRFRWWPEDDEGATSEVTYVLDPDEDGTRLRVTERPVGPGSGSASASACASASGRWTAWDDRIVGLWCLAAVPVALACR